MFDGHGGSQVSHFLSCFFHLAHDSKKIASTNEGDSGAVICRKDKVAVDLTRDHTPYDPIEKARIESAGLSNQREGEFKTVIPSQVVVSFESIMESLWHERLDTALIVQGSFPNPRSRAFT